MKTTFVISEKEEELIAKWQTEHNAGNECIYERMCCYFEAHGKNEPHTTDSRYTGVIGGQFGYKFIPTGVGTIVKTYCGCGKEKDCTDYSDW